MRAITSETVSPESRMTGQAFEEQAADAQISARRSTTFPRLFGLM